MTINALGCCVCIWATAEWMTSQATAASAEGGTYTLIMMADVNSWANNRVVSPQSAVQCPRYRDVPSCELVRDYTTSHSISWSSVQTMRLMMRSWPSIARASRNIIISAAKVQKRKVSIFSRSLEKSFQNSRRKSKQKYKKKKKLWKTWKPTGAAATDCHLVQCHSNHTNVWLIYIQK